MFHKITYNKVAKFVFLELRQTIDRQRTMNRQELQRMQGAKVGGSASVHSVQRLDSGRDSGKKKGGAPSSGTSGSVSSISSGTSGAGSAGATFWCFNCLCLGHRQGDCPQSQDWSVHTWFHEPLSPEVYGRKQSVRLQRLQTLSRH